MKHNKLKYKDLINLLDFSIDYFKQDINYKINNDMLEGKLIETISYYSKEQNGFFMEGIEINGTMISCVAYDIESLKNSNLNYKDFKFRELLTYLTIWGLQTQYEVGYLKVPKLSAQKSDREWGISDIK